MSRPNSKHDFGEEEVALSYHYMEKYFRVAVNINAVPYHYNKQKRRFRLDRKSLKYKLWMLLMLFGMLAETAQATKELIRGSLDDTVGRGEWSLVLFIFISWVFVTSTHFNTYLRGEDIVSYINQVMGTRAYFKESNLPMTSDHKIVRAHIYVSCAQCFFQALMVAAEGLKPQYLFSNVPEEYRNPLTWAIWIPYAYYRVMSNFQAGYFQYFVGILHIQTCNQILMYRRMIKETPEQGLKTYRMIQLLSKRYNFAIAYTFIPAITLFAAGNIVAGIFGTLRFSNELDFNLYMNFPLMVMMMILFVVSFYPKNAAMKELSDGEGTRMLFSCLNMEDILERPKSTAIANETQAVESNQKPTAAMAQLLTKQPRRPTLVLNSKEEEASHDNTAQLKRFGGMFQKKMDNMLEKIHRYKLARSFARSCPYLAVRLAGFFPIDRTAVLTIFDFIINSTVSALLTWS
ncbi:unnamed protein product [Allacma fusca]|uniref:Uncharacterized protein n=1 Tax=Allacma fusca TaxID=39272 RepID=A0A8J2NVW3_9HEXA|nr:unnamed protein product [Allacma fusca]